MAALMVVDALAALAAFVADALAALAAYPAAVTMDILAALVVDATLVLVALAAPVVMLAALQHPLEDCLLVALALLVGIAHTNS